MFKAQGREKKGHRMGSWWSREQLRWSSCHAGVSTDWASKDLGAASSAQVKNGQRRWIVSCGHTYGKPGSSYQKLQLKIASMCLFDALMRWWGPTTLTASSSSLVTMVHVTLPVEVFIIKKKVLNTQTHYVIFYQHCHCLCMWWSPFLQAWLAQWKHVVNVQVHHRAAQTCPDPSRCSENLDLGE